MIFSFFVNLLTTKIEGEVSIMIEGALIKLIDAKKDSEGFMSEEQLEQFIDAQKASMWPDVDCKNVNGREKRDACRAPRPNYVNCINKIIDQNRNNEE
jgi:hypothetical protein